MQNETRKQLETILREAQYKVNSLCSGYRILLVEAERTEADIHSDVRNALQDRKAAGLSASNYNFPDAPLTLDGVDVSRAERELIQRALDESSGIEMEK